MATVVGASSRSRPAPLLLICLSEAQTKRGASATRTLKTHPLKYLNARVVHAACRALFDLPSRLSLCPLWLLFSSFFTNFSHFSI